MDTAETTHLSLCAGYGGIDLGLRRVLPNLRTIAYAEIEAFACELLLSRMEGGQLDAAPIWSNLKSFPWEQFSGMVDILSGGYPCQPFSSAGKRLGTEDERHLWPYIASGIRILKPRVCFFENVEGHISLGLRDVLRELGEMGYRATWGIFSASEVGAPHQRKRVFIMAVASGIRGAAGLSGSLARNEGITGIANHCSAQDIWPSRPGEPQHEWEPPRVVGDAQNERRRGLDDESSETKGGQARGHSDGTSTSEQQEQQQTQPPLGGDADGPAGGLDYADLCQSSDNRTDELRLLGNGVVPATAAKAFRTLIHDLEAYIPRNSGL